jgi:hypothetical protein
MAYRFASIKRVYTCDFGSRVFPLVYILGRPSYILAQWTHLLMTAGITQSMLDERLRTMIQLWEFSVAKYGEAELTSHQARSLVPDFIAARSNGTIDADGNDPLGLFWKKLPKSTVKKYVRAINAFDEFQAAYQGAPRLNPTERHLMTAWQVCQEFRTREKWDAMLHLLPAGRVGRAERKQNEHVVKDSHARFTVDNKNLPKAFPLDRFVDLIERSACSRDKMMWLLMFGLALRQSETLHIFLEDCFGVDKLGCARIRLDDPELGVFRWFDLAGKLHHGNRAEYLRQMYRNDGLKDSIPNLYAIEPRTMYGGHGGMRVGFKGMTFDECETTIPGIQSFGHEGRWIDHRLGVYFQTCFEQYFREHFFGKPKGWPYHPYLLICLDDENYGMPLTIPAVRKAWRRALARIGMGDWFLGPHGLRHLTGYYSASVLKQPIEITKLILRHKSVSSTEVYYHLSSNEVRNSLLKSVVERNGQRIEDYLLFPGAQPLKVPEHWVAKGGRF